MNLHCVWTRFELIRRLGPSRLTSVLLKDRGWILNNTKMKNFDFFLNDKFSTDLVFEHVW